MALRQVLNIDLRHPYQKFNKSQEKFAKQNTLFGQPVFTPAEAIEIDLRNELNNMVNEDPEAAEKILSNAINGKKVKPEHRQALRRAGLNDFDLSSFQGQQRLDRQQSTQASFVISTAASFTFNNALKIAGNAAANQAVTSGKVVQFENQQRNFNNIKRGTSFAGSLAGIGFGIASANPLVVLGAATAFVNQSINLAIENSRISAKQERQDSNAEFYQQAFGNIVRRGNR